MRKRLVLVFSLLVCAVLIPACSGSSSLTTGAEDGKKEKVDVVKKSGDALSTGVYEVTGEVQNKTSGAAAFVKVKVTFLDAGKQVIDETSASVNPDVLDPDEKGTFTVQTSKPDVGGLVAAYEVRVSYQ